MPKSANFSVKYRIYYEDTDSQGIVYYANYLKFFERARTEFLRSKGIMQTQLVRDENLLFVVRKCEIEYFSSARLDDLVEISVEITEIKNASIIIKQEAKIADKILVSLLVVIVTIDSKNYRPAKIPEKIVKLIKN